MPSPTSGSGSTGLTRRAGYAFRDFVVCAALVFAGYRWGKHRKSSGTVAELHHDVNEKGIGPEDRKLNRGKIREVTGFVQNPGQEDCCQGSCEFIGSKACSHFRAGSWTVGNGHERSLSNQLLARALMYFYMTADGRLTVELRNQIFVLGSDGFLSNSPNVTLGRAFEVPSSLPVLRAAAGLSALYDW